MRWLLAGLTIHIVASAKNNPDVPRTQLSNPCRRDISRSVRKQLDKEVLKVASRAGVDKWPADCPFDPGLDLYGYHEKQKQRKRPGSQGTSWTCGICGKTFKSEHYLDLHLENKHMNETPSNGVCLADYCEVFEVCQGDSKWKSQRHKNDECDAEALATARSRCEEGLRKCFPLDQEEARKLHAQLSRHWCQVLDCRIREEKRKEHEYAMIPVVVLLILMLLACFIVFSVVICCVDYSDDIFNFLVESRLASLGFVKRLITTREKTREAVGLSRTKNI